MGINKEDVVTPLPPNTPLSKIVLSQTYSSIPGTAGELVQGQINGEDFLVTNPIELYSKVQVMTRKGNGKISVYPSHRSKARQAVGHVLRVLDVHGIDVDVSIESQIPMGKGMASSTADIVAAVEATAQALGFVLSSEQVSAIATTIEPSDGLMYRVLGCYNHRQGELLEVLGSVPATTQVVIDLGGTIDTIEFNRTPKNYSPFEIDAFGEMIKLLREGTKRADLALIGRVATWSCQINQRLLFKPELDSVLAIATCFSAFGVACAHSGTILSLIFPPESSRDELENVQKQIATKFDRRYPTFIVRSAQSW